MDTRSLGRWRKLYVKPSPSWELLPVTARGLGDELLRYCDDHGRIDLGTEDMAAVVWRLLRAHRHERRRITLDLAALVADGYLVVEPHPAGLAAGKRLAIRNFTAAQTAVSGSAQRMRDLRERESATAENRATPNRSRNKAGTELERSASPRNRSEHVRHSDANVTDGENAARCAGTELERSWNGAGTELERSASPRNRSEHVRHSDVEKRREEIEERLPSVGDASVREGAPTRPPASAPAREVSLDVRSVDSRSVPVHPSGSPGLPGIEPAAGTATPSNAKGARRRGPTPPRPDTHPEPGTPARAVFDALVADPIARPITLNPGEFATRVCNPAIYPGVDVLAEVHRALAWLANAPPSRHKGNGQRFLMAWLRKAADEIAAKGAPAAAPPGAANGHRPNGSAPSGGWKNGRRTPGPAPVPTSPAAYVRDPNEPDDGL